MTKAPSEAVSTAPHALPWIVIEPNGSAVEWLELWRFRDLFLILAQRDIRLRYRQTAFGIIQARRPGVERSRARRVPR
jgi:lipopolysaccharide transport system permease protein